MCDLTDSKGKWTGLAGQFIAETNAFLARYWDHADVRWPLKTATGISAAPPDHGTTSDAGPAPRLFATTDAPAPEHIEQISALRRLVEHDKDVRDGKIYLILVLVPESQVGSSGAHEPFGQVSIRGVPLPRDKDRSAGSPANGQRRHQRRRLAQQATIAR